MIWMHFGLYIESLHRPQCSPLGSTRRGKKPLPFRACRYTTQHTEHAWPSNASHWRMLSPVSNARSLAWPSDVITNGVLMLLWNIWSQHRSAVLDIVLMTTNRSSKRGYMWVDMVDSMLAKLSIPGLKYLLLTTKLLLISVLVVGALQIWPKFCFP